MTLAPNTVAGRAALLERNGLTVLKPFGFGPFPVVLQLHGCAGSQPFERLYAEAAVRAGVAVVMIDSFRPRGMSRLDGSLFVCTGAALRGSQRAGDLYAVLHWLKGQSWADSSRVMVAGWSHGGWTIMDALAQGPEAARMTGLTDAHPEQLKGLRGAFLVYPYAAFPSLTSTRGWNGARPKVFAVLGGRDQVVGERYPRRAFDRLTRDGLPVDLLYFPEATHSFDDDAAVDPRTKYRADLREQSLAYFGKALNASLG